MKQTKSEVLALRDTVIGCCNRFADNQPCDCLENAIPDEDRVHQVVSTEPSHAVSVNAEMRNGEPVAVIRNSWKQEEGTVTCVKAITIVENTEVVTSRVNRLIQMAYTACGITHPNLWEPGGEEEGYPRMRAVIEKAIRLGVLAERETLAKIKGW